MADREKKKAAYRSRLLEKQQKNRIDSPLVRYNEIGKPVCRVCDVLLKSDSDWTVHQASRKHHEAINNIRASAVKQTVVNNAKSETIRVSPKQGDGTVKLNDDKPRISFDVQKSQPSSALPADFFDHGGNKRPKVEPALVQKVDTGERAIPDPVKSSKREIQPARIAENVAADSETKQIKGELPTGFFDNKEADLRARGIEPVKPDVKDEYKEFEKLIQEDLAEVDNRFEEEEIDAAEQIEEEEIIEQRTYRSRVEELKRKKMELLAARSSGAGKVSEVPESNSKQDDTSTSSSEDEDDESFAVDWRAQHL